MKALANWSENIGTVENVWSYIRQNHQRRYENRKLGWLDRKLKCSDLTCTFVNNLYLELTNVSLKSWIFGPVVPVTAQRNMNRMNLNEPVQTWSDGKTRSEWYCTISHELRGRNERLLHGTESPTLFGFLNAWWNWKDISITLKRNWSKSATKWLAD